MDRKTKLRINWWPWPVVIYAEPNIRLLWIDEIMLSPVPSAVSVSINDVNAIDDSWKYWTRCSSCRFNGGDRNNNIVDVITWLRLWPCIVCYVLCVVCCVLCGCTCTCHIVQRVLISGIIFHVRIVVNFDNFSGQVCFGENICFLEDENPRWFFCRSTDEEARAPTRMTPKFVLLTPEMSQKGSDIDCARRPQKVKIQWWRRYFLPQLLLFVVSPLNWLSSVVRRSERARNSSCSKNI